MLERQGLSWYEATSEQLNLPFPDLAKNSKGSLRDDVRSLFVATDQDSWSLFRRNQLSARL